MNSKAPVALAIGVGYLLGRNHKLRWAVMLGAAAATGRLGGLSTQVLEKGTEFVKSSPELSKMTDTAGRLLEAGRSAAVSAMNSQVESMEAKLQERTGELGEKAEGALPVGKRDKSKAAGDEGGRDEERAQGDEYADEDQYDEEDEFDEEDEDEGDEDEEDEDEDDEDEDDEDEDQDDQPADEASTRRGSTARRGSPGSVVRKSGR